MPNDTGNDDFDDKKQLAKFASSRGEAFRTVLAVQDDITKWLNEGWPLIAIFRLLRHKGVVRNSFGAFRRAVNMIIKTKKQEDTSKHTTEALDHDETAQETAPKRKPHEVQRKKQQQFVTLTGVDHIGLGKKEE